MRLPTKAGLHDGIVRAGVQLGAELGEEGLTMRAIAAQLGISVTNIYQHFENKAAILREIRILGFSLLDQALIDASTEPDCVVRLQHMSDAYIRFARSNQWLYTQLFDGDLLAWSTLPAEDHRVALGPMATTRAALAEGVAQGSFRADLDVGQGVLAIWASLHGVASLLLHGRLGVGHPTFPLPDTSAFVHAFVETLVCSFRR